MPSVYARHSPPGTSDDINYKRCQCPKVSVKDAVMRFLKSKRDENLADSTITN
jgi:hypothetical protein